MNQAKKLFIREAFTKKLDTQGAQLISPSHLGKLPGSTTNKGNWSRIFNGQTQPSIKHILFLSKVLKCSTDDVINIFVKAEEVDENTNISELLNKLHKSFETPELMPKANRYFIGRSKELEEATDKLICSDIQGVVIVAFPGMGKTTLAKHLVYELQGQMLFFDKVAWVALNPQIGTGEPPTFKESISSLLFEITDGDITRETISQDNENQLIQRVINQIKKRKCLLIFDNAETLLSRADSDQAGLFSRNAKDYAYLFKQIIESEHKSKFLITSREEFIELSPSCYRINLEGLSLEDGVELVEILSSEKKTRELSPLKGSKKDLEDFVKHYLGIPKILELAVSLVQMEFKGDIREFLNSSPPTAFERTLEQVLERLSTNEKRCLSRISIYQTQQYPLFEEGIYAQLPDLIPQEVREVISGLKCRRLLSVDPVSGAFIIHPFVTEQSYKILTPKDAEIAHC